MMDALTPKSLVSSLNYILLNKTFHDNHYDAFPGFVGRVGFDEVSLADGDEVLEADFYKCFRSLGNLMFLILQRILDTNAGKQLS
jgi:hypothetical protein